MALGRWMLAALIFTACGGKSGLEIPSPPADEAPWGVDALHCALRVEAPFDLPADFGPVRDATVLGEAAEVVLSEGEGGRALVLGIFGTPPRLLREGVAPPGALFGSAAGVLALDDDCTLTPHDHELDTQPPIQLFEGARCEGHVSVGAELNILVRGSGETELHRLGPEAPFEPTRVGALGALALERSASVVRASNGEVLVVGRDDRGWALHRKPAGGTFERASLPGPSRVVPGGVLGGALMVSLEPPHEITHFGESEARTWVSLVETEAFAVLETELVSLRPGALDIFFLGRWRSAALDLPEADAARLVLEEGGSQGGVVIERAGRSSYLPLVCRR